jgi:MFS family permease
MPAFRAPTPVGLRDLYRTSPAGVVGMFATGISQGATIGMGAVYGRAIGLSLGEISLFMGAILVGGMVLQWPIGRLSDVFDRRMVMTVVTFLAAALALVATFMAGRSSVGLLALVALFGGTMMPMYSLAVAHTNDHLKPEQMTDASGALVLIGGLGAILGPVTAAGAMTLLGPDAFFWWLAVIHAAIGGFVLYRMTRRPALPLAEQGAYVALPPRATTMAATLYAEAVEEPEENSDGSDAGPTEDNGNLEEIAIESS